VAGIALRIQFVAEEQVVGTRELQRQRGEPNAVAATVNAGHTALVYAAGEGVCVPL